MNTKSDVAAATVIGADHRRADRPCQDAFAVRRAGDAVVVVVCDGCGGAPHSELGARLGANLLATALVARLGRGAPDDAAWWRAACDDVIAALGGLVPALGAPPAAIHDHLLFTVLATVVTPDTAAVLAIGDGVIVLDDDVRVRHDDAPAYLAYELLGAEVPRELVVAPGAASIVIASDGAAALLPRAGELLPGDRGPLLDLARVAADERLFANPDALRRRLAVASQDTTEVEPASGRVVRRGGLLTDDTTVVVIRRRP